MLKLFLFFCVIFAASAFGPITERDTVVAVDLGPNRLRIVAVSEFPDFVNPKAVEVDAIAAFKDNKTGTFDAASFRFVTPAFVDPNVTNYETQLTQYFAYFTAREQIIQTDMGRVDKIDAAFFQQAFRIFDIFIYVNKDGVPGYQFSFANPINLCVGGNPNADCLLAMYGLSNATQVFWNNLAFSKVTLTYQGTNFNIYSLTASTTDGVFTYTFHVVEHTAIVNGKTITPDFTKIDIRIQYFNNALFTPPAYVTATPAAAVGIFAISVGSVAAASFIGGVAANTHQFGIGKVTGFFAWEAAAITSAQGVINGTSTVYFTILSAAAIQAATQVSLGQLGFLKVVVGVYAVFGWALDLYWFSWAEQQPSDIMWDPTFGANINYNSGGTFSIPITMILSAFLLLFLISSRK